MDIPPISGISLNPAELTVLNDVNPVSGSQPPALGTTDTVDISNLANLASEVEISAKAQGFATTIALLSQKIASVAANNNNTATAVATPANLAVNLPVSINALSVALTPSLDTKLNLASTGNLHGDALASQVITTPEISSGNAALITEAQLPASQIYAVANPVLAAAVAAYRMGEGIKHTPDNQMLEKSVEAVNDIEAITGVQAVNLNLHEQSGHFRQEQAGTDASNKRPADGNEDTIPVETGAIDIRV